MSSKSSQNSQIKDDNYQKLDEFEFGEMGDAELRKGFIRKVFGILSAQLGLTAALIGFTKAYPEMNRWMEEQYGIFWTCFCFSIIIQIVIICNKNLAKKVPGNYIALFLYTVC
mmetsp:Transcript_18336/g.13189  ORF Transcript_18336/g.13189 Transcript_18336/m.13189 type:complete len:113 (-) Transcript_18336:496-834(-)